MAQGLIIRKITRNWEDYGALSTFKKSLAYLLKPVFERVLYRVYRIEINGKALGRVPDGQFRYRMIGPEDDEIIDQIEVMEEWLSGKLREKLLAGGLCLVALDGRKVAGFNLVAFKEASMPLVKMKRALRGHEAWSEQITVHPAYRRQGLASGLRLSVFRELAKRNIRKVYGGTLRENKGSLGLSRKVGFKELGDIRYMKILGCKSHRFQRAVK